jgi:hypothetical protein
MSEDHILLNPYAKTENHKRNVRTLAENAKGKKMTRKVDTWEYESPADCIRMDQVPTSEIAEIFTDKSFYKYYKNKYF